MLVPGEGLRPQRAQHRGRRDPQPRRRPRDRRARRAAPGQHDRRQPARREGPRRRPRTSSARPPSCGSARCSAGPVPVGLADHHHGQGRDHHDGQGRDRPRPPRARRRRTVKARPRRPRVRERGPRRCRVHHSGTRRAPIGASGPSPPTPIVARFAATHAHHARGRRRSAPFDGRHHDGRGHHADHGRARPPPRLRPRSPVAPRSIKQSPPDTDSAQQVVLPDRDNTSCYVLGPAIVTGQERRLREYRQYDSTNVAVGHQRPLQEQRLPRQDRGPVRQQGRRDRARRRRAVGADHQPGHHRPRRRDLRQLHPRRGEAARAGAALRRAPDAVRPVEADRRERVADARQGPAHGRASSPASSASPSSRSTCCSSTGCSGLVVIAGLGPHRHAVLHGGLVPVEHARPHAHAGGCDRHHCVRRCHRRLLCRVFRTTQRRGAHGQDRALVARARLPRGRSARSSPPTSCR